MNSPAELLSSAFALHQAGRAADAEPLYRRLLAAEPRHADALHLLGVLCLQSNRAAEAAELIAQACALRPDNPEFANHLGAAYGALERHDEAVAALRRAVQLSPGNAGAHYNLGTALRNAGRMAEAAVSLRHAVAADPNSAPAHYNLANTLRDLNQLDEAAQSYRQALAVRPGYVKAMINLGNVLRDQRKFDEAVHVLEGAVALDPKYAPAHLNLGTVLRDAGRFEAAIECLQTAVALAPQSAEAHNNLGTALQSLARFDEAGRAYDEALRLDPELPDAHFSRATHWLRGGDFERGFAEYEWRWKCRTFSDRGFAQPRWDGAPLAGRTILLYAEQGLGDTLQFVRYARHAQRLGGRTIVECQKPLLSILAAVPGVDELIAIGSPLPPFDVHAPLMSLPGILHLKPEEFWNAPYLVADAKLVATWQAKLAAHLGFRVGICWQGNPQHMFDSQRSFALSRLAPVAAVPGTRLVSLQKGAAPDELAACGFDVIDLGPALDAEAGPFMDSAAVIKNLDLVITSDTAIAHLAGGLGARVWLALSAHGDWRWCHDRADTPWYPTMRLFRQSALGQWDAVFEQMADAARALIAADSG